VYIRFPAPPGGLARSLTVRRSPVTGEVVVTAGPPLPSGPGAVWAPALSGVAQDETGTLAGPVGSGRDS